MERKPAAILVADAAGYSPLMSNSERETYAQVKADLANVCWREAQYTWSDAPEDSLKTALDLVARTALRSTSPRPGRTPCSPLQS